MATALARTTMNASVLQLALPSFPIAGRSVLDIGCADGASLMHSHYQGASKRCGVDVDRAAIEQGWREYPDLEIAIANAEDLPYEDASFDVVISKVTLLYTDLRKSFAEAHRVMKPGGDLFLTTHDWRHHCYHFGRALKTRTVKRSLDHVYILGASAVYIATGHVPARPWNGTRETFQNRGSLRRGLTLAGFVGISFERTARDFIVTAKKAAV
jgi:ubiquinone/menaquinone biosynthesis C-methylase UbiE